MLMAVLNRDGHFFLTVEEAYAYLTPYQHPISIAACLFLPST